MTKNILDFSDKQNVADFFKEKVIENVRNQLHSKLRVMFEKPKPQMIQKEADNLFILDQIVDVQPENENSGKSPKLIYDICLGKIRDYERIHEQYEYKASEYDFDSFGGMRLIFHFVKKKEY